RHALPSRPPGREPHGPPDHRRRGAHRACAGEGLHPQGRAALRAPRDRALAVRPGRGRGRRRGGGGPAQGQVPAHARPHARLAVLPGRQRAGLGRHALHRLVRPRRPARLQPRGHVPEPPSRPRRAPRRDPPLPRPQLRRSSTLDDRRREAHQHDDALPQPEGLLVGDGSWMKELCQLGETPPLGEVPRRMLAQVVRQDRFGEPTRAFKVEQVEVPSELRPDEVLVWVMAAGINYNNVWAALGTPVDVIKSRQKDPYFPDPNPFHIGGSDASGIVWKVGSAVRNVKLGDQVVIHCGVWSQDDPVVKSGADPMFGPSFRIWGYETSWGSFAQFTRVQAHQCLPKPPELSWDAAAAYMLVGATASRMLGD